MIRLYCDPALSGGEGGRIIMDITTYLRICQEQGASDLHFFKDEPPVLRIDGKLRRLEAPPLGEEELAAMLLGLLTPVQHAAFVRESDVNVALSLPGLHRFRVNIHKERGAVEGAFRHLPGTIPSLRALGLPPIVDELVASRNGLVLITGPVGMGKSTTLASVVDHLNAQTESLIITIEDPIEYVHQNKKSFVRQREVHADTPSFAAALKNALRQDPNTIAIGEMRDLETIATALTAAETGHLVLATLHTHDAQHAIQRIVDVFPSAQQAQIRTQLADSLRGVVSQLLLTAANERGRVLASEVLVATSAVRNVIRQNQLEQIPTLVQTGGKYGMQSMAKSLADLVHLGHVRCTTAMNTANFADGFVCPVVAKSESPGKSAAPINFLS